MNFPVWEDHDPRPCGSQVVGARLERSDSKNPALVVPFAYVAVRRIRHGTTRGTRSDCRFEEASALARRALSSECWRLLRSDPRAAPRILASKRRVVLWLLESFAPCSR